MALPAKWTLVDFLALTYFKKVSSSIMRQAVGDYASLDKLMNSHDENPLLAKIRQSSLFNEPLDVNRELAEQQLELCKKNDVKIITLWDSEYPELLGRIDLPPLAIFVKGNLQPPDSVSISIIGTRRKTLYGKLMAEKFASCFAKNNIIVTSGLADGIDTESHMACIQSGGITYAVIASGIDCMSPSITIKNADKIISSGGAIISEYKCGSSVQVGYFPQRNRIISGISKATVVIESGEKGGSLITAKFAGDQSRDLFAVPGNINSEKSKGTNLLIKKNLAIPALSPESVLDDLDLINHLGAGLNDTQKNNLSPEDSKVLSVLSHEPMHIDDIAIASSMDFTEILVKMLDLEFRGLVRQLPGKNYIIQ